MQWVERPTSWPHRQINLLLPKDLLELPKQPRTMNDDLALDICFHIEVHIPAAFAVVGPGPE
jgi:hypothetical protein